MWSKELIENNDREEGEQRKQKEHKQTQRDTNEITSRKGVKKEVI